MDHFLQLRILEAMLFAAAEPVDEKLLRDRMPEGADVKALLEEQPNPSPDEIRDYLAGNICRCGAYPEIVKAARQVASAERR